MPEYRFRYTWRQKPILQISEIRRPVSEHGGSLGPPQMVWRDATPAEAEGLLIACCAKEMRPPPERVTLPSTPPGCRGVVRPAPPTEPPPESGIEPPSTLPYASLRGSYERRSRDEILGTIVRAIKDLALSMRQELYDSGVNPDLEQKLKAAGVAPWATRKETEHA